jgi:hypothetical protein
VKPIHFTFTYLTVFVVSLMTDALNTELVIGMTIAAILSILDKLGRGIVLRESIATLYIFTCLDMPMLGYRVYNFQNPLSRAFKKYMLVPETDYFNLALPAISGFCMMLSIPMRSEGSSDEGDTLKVTFEKCRRILVHDQAVGMAIMFIGILSLILNELLPVSLQYIGIILFFTSFAGMLYVKYTEDLPYRNVILFIFVLFLILNGILIGMFTIVAYMGITIFSYFFMGSKVSLGRKISFFLFAIFFVVVLQNTKTTYRKMIRNAEIRDNKAATFAVLFFENLQQGSAFFEERNFFLIYTRMNQGNIVTQVMQRIPVIQPFDDGKYLFKTILSSFVPRFLWPDKPEAGGRFNMQYYAGKKMNMVTSMNVGPLGEAYGSFGTRQAILFMVLLGLFIRWVYGIVFRISRKTPLLVLWLPVMFYQITYSAETDTLQILNSFIKTTFFIWILYRFLPRWFGKSERTARAKLNDVKLYS